MERKFKIIGIYLGLLSFAAIIMILITSFSFNKIEPSIYVENNLDNKNYNHNTPLEQSVSQLTENNQLLNDEINELKKEISEKDKIINEFSENTDDYYLNQASKFFVNDNLVMTKEMIGKIDLNKLSVENKEVYNNLLKKIK